VVLVTGLLCLSILQVANPNLLLNIDVEESGPIANLPGVLMFITSAFMASIVLGSVEIRKKQKNVKAGYRRTPFGYFIKFIAGNPIMPIIAICGVIGFTSFIFTTFGKNNYGVEFFVEGEPEQAIVYVKARGNLSLVEKDILVRQAELIVNTHPGVESVFSFAGTGGLNQNTAGATAPKDTIGQIQLETIPWENRRGNSELDGNKIIAELSSTLSKLPGIEIEILELERGPASPKPVHLRLKGDNWNDLLITTAEMRELFDQTEGLIQVEDTRPLPGIDWQIDVDVEKAGRYGADVATVGAMVQLVTRGILLDTMRVDSSDEEIEIRVRLPEEDRFLSTLDNLKVRTADGLVPLSNFISRKPVTKLAEINRIEQKRYFDIKAGVQSDLKRTIVSDEGMESEVFINANERIAYLTEYLEENPLPPGMSWEWTGDQADQAESQAFLSSAFAAALVLMFIILLAQFNSFYNSFVVLIAVVLSTVGVLIGMLVMQQPFSIIMTGTGIVALAGIVVNNNIVLIDTYQELSRYLPKVEAIVRTAEQRIRPVLLTTITTMAGLAPMMFGLSLDFVNGGYSVDSPTALWWKQLATAVVFGLGTATMLTLVFTPALLSARVWVTTYVLWIARLLVRVGASRRGQVAQDWALRKMARKTKPAEIIWDYAEPPLLEKEELAGLIGPAE
jgi:multidrug efflux pump